jgi:sporulation protein YlmC with PRC-barrel domain
MITFEKLIGMKVITSGAHILGEVKGGKIDTKTWEVKLLQVKLAGSSADKLGVKKRFGSSNIGIPVSFIQAIGEVITIGKSIEELENAHQITAFKD